MERPKVWTKRLVLLLLLIIVSTWLIAEGSQWVLRWRAGKMLADIQSIELDKSTSAQADALLKKWNHWGTRETNCREATCFSGVSVRDNFIVKVHGFVDPETENWRGRMLDYLGLRVSAVRAGFMTENGLVIQKGFDEEVTLPVSHWFDRGDAYVPDLVVSSVEVLKFSEADRFHLQSVSSRHFARRMKGPYGVVIKFTPDDFQENKEAMMDFRFSCITQLRPCLNESELLPISAALLPSQH